MTEAIPMYDEKYLARRIMGTDTVFDSITSLAVDASQHNVVDACPALNSSDSRHKRINNARSNIINGYISSFVAGRIKNL